MYVRGTYLNIENAMAVLGKGDTKRKAGSKQKPNNSKLVPLGSLVHPPSVSTFTTHNTAEMSCA